MQRPGWGLHILDNQGVIHANTNETNRWKTRIGNDVTVAVLDVKRNQIRIGIDAPREVAVHREEVYNHIQNEEMAKQESSASQWNSV